MTDAEAGVDAWKEHTSAFDRVRSVAQTLARPRSASWIAEEAAVAPNTAHDHLDRLVDLNVLREVPGESATLYEPDPLHVRIQTIRDLLEEHDRADLVELKRSLQEEIETWRAEYDVDSPAELRELAAATETAEETRRIDRVANEWELVTYRLSVVEDAIENYSDYTGHAAAI